MNLGESLKLDRWEVIYAMFQGPGPSMKHVVEVFFTGAEHNLARIRAGREQNRRDWCVSAGHSLKSSSANLGLERVSVLSSHLEAKAETMSAGELDQMLLILSVELEDARRAILAHMKETL